MFASWQQGSSAEAVALCGCVSLSLTNLRCLDPFLSFNNYKRSTVKRRSFIDPQLSCFHNGICRRFWCTEEHCFYGSDGKFELWFVKFKAHLRFPKLLNVVKEERGNDAKFNERYAQVFAEFVTFLDDKTIPRYA